MSHTVSKKTTFSHHGADVDEVEVQTLSYLVYFLFGIVEALLAFRLVFKLMGANPGSNFVGFIYGMSQLFVIPFGGIFRQATTQGIETTAVLEPATLVAMVVYAFLAWGVAQIFVILSGKLQ